MLLAGWKLLYFHPERFRADSAQGPEWNRGAYLVQGIAHCGACHTPRNALGAEKQNQFLAGGEAEGWTAPALNASSHAPVPWTAESLARYLREGIADVHEVAVGPMAPVVHSLSAVSEQDVRAIATYIASVMDAGNPERQARAQQALTRARSVARDIEAQSGRPRNAAEERTELGAAIYNSTCAACHDRTERPPGAPSSDALHLALSTSVAATTPRNLVRIVIQGMTPPDGESGPLMPGFGNILTDEQIAAVATYVRAAYSGQPAWSNVDRAVRETRQQVVAAR
jgi:mono/diheme cytochrome c family protein